MVPINTCTLRFKSVGTLFLAYFFKIFLQMLRSIFVKVRLFTATKKSRKKVGSKLLDFFSPKPLRIGEAFIVSKKKGVVGGESPLLTRNHYKSTIEVPLH